MVQPKTSDVGLAFFLSLLLFGFLLAMSMISLVLYILAMLCLMIAVSWVYTRNRAEWEAPYSKQTVQNIAWYKNTRVHMAGALLMLAAVFLCLGIVAGPLFQSYHIPGNNTFTVILSCSMLVLLFAVIFLAVLTSRLVYSVITVGTEQ